MIGLNHGTNEFLWNRSQQGLQIRMHDRLAAERYRLVKQAQAIAHTALAGPGKSHQAPLLNHDLILIDHMAKPFDDLGSRNPPEVVMLAAGENRRRNLVNLGGGKNKYYMRRRLLQRLQQRVEGRVRQHVDFVDDVDSVLPTKRSKLHVLSDLAHIVHARIGRPIDLHDIDRSPLCNFEAVGTDAAGRAGWPLLAIECLGENSRDRGFSHTAGSGKEIRLGNPFRGDGIDQRLNNVGLSDHIIERPWTVFAGRDLVIQRRDAPVEC